MFTNLSDELQKLSVHIDFTIESGMSRLSRHLTPEEYQKFNDGSWRMRIIKYYYVVSKSQTSFTNIGLQFLETHTSHRQELPAYFL